MARRGPALARREREIMDVVYRHGRATSRQIRKELEDPPHPAAVRTLLRILEAKGQQETAASDSVIATMRKVARARFGSNN
jgi:predicted transcriptional regulator